MSLYDISEIERIYPNWYNPSSVLSKDDQQFIWETLQLPEEDEQRLRTRNTSSAGDYVLEGVNATYKIGVKFELNVSQLTAIEKLKQCRRKTPPVELSLLLEQLFEKWPAKDGHWLSIAQTFTARVINRVIKLTFEQYQRGAIKKTPSAFFTFKILLRSRRKDLS